MPLYEYQCLHCQHRFDLRRSFEDRRAIACPKCQGEAQRVFSPAALIFKGPGFYTTDNRKNGPKPEEPATASS